MPHFFQRHARVVIALSAGLCGASLWIVLVLKFGMSHAEAVLITGLALLSLAQLHVFIDRAREARAVRAEIDNILIATGELLGDVATLSDDVRAMSQRMGEKNYLHADRLAGQVRALEGVIERIADAEERREALADAADAARPATVAGRAPVAPPASAAEPPSIEPVLEAEPEPEAEVEVEPEADPAPARPAPDLRLVRSVETAVAERRADIYLQPIVTLPQRKVRFYEALTRLRDDDGRTLLPGDYLGPAAAAGVMPEIDNAMLLRSIGMVRRFLERRRDIGMFCNISTSSLGDGAFFPRFLEQMSASPELAAVLVFEFAQGEVGRFGPIEEESLAALAALGFRFSLDHVEDLGLDFQGLAGAGFRYVKVGAARLLDATGAADAPVHPQDLGRLAARSGIKLIAEKIEHEAAVVNLLDHDITLAQGYLFSRPRLVREEAGETGARAAA